MKQAIKKFRSAISNREREAARKEVMDALAALEKARREAGLSPKSPLETLRSHLRLVSLAAAVLRPHRSHFVVSRVLST